MQSANQESTNEVPDPTLVEPEVHNKQAAAENTSIVGESSPGYYGWRVVLAAGLGVMAGFGSLFVYTFSVFVKSLAADFGWTREAISGGFAIAAITLGTVSPLLGRWIDRFGPRHIILACMTVLGARSPRYLCCVPGCGNSTRHALCWVSSAMVRRILPIRDQSLAGFKSD